MLLRIYIRNMRVVRVGDRVVSGAELGEEEEDEGGECELDNHVETCCEEREVEVEMFGVEHPFIVLGNL